MFKMRKRTVVGAFLTAAASLALIAPTAQAVDYHGCTSGSLCVWNGANFQGGPLNGGAKMSQNNLEWKGSDGVNWSIWDNDESWVNHSSGGNSVGVYALTRYGGYVEVCVWPGTNITRNSSSSTLTYNQGRSNRWKSGYGCYAAS